MCRKYVQGMRINYVRIQKSKNSCISCPLDDGKKTQYRNAVIFYTEKLGGEKQSKKAPLNAASQHRNGSVGPILCFPKWQLQYSQFTATCYYVHQP
jgi:hypothetical protein